MRANTRTLRVILAALAAAAVAALGWSFAFIRNPSTSLPVKWPAGPVSLRLMLGDTADLSDGHSFNSSAAAAAQIWNGVLGAIQFQPTLATGTATNGNGVNEAVFASTVFGQGFGESTIAIATTFRSGNERIEGDVIFRSDRVWNSFRGTRPSNLDPTALDLQRVALHEFGHVLGLDHPDEAGQQVFAVMNSRVSSIDALQDDDIAGGRTLYGPPGVPPNDNFANAIALTLGSTPTLTVTGHNTNATKEAGEPSHASNSGPGGAANPGGRSVWWRWTAPSVGSVTIDTRGSVFDTILGVHTGATVGALTRIAGNDDIEAGAVQASTVTFNTTAGAAYQIAVDGFNNEDGQGADSGGITLNLAFDGSLVGPPVITTQPASVTVTAGGTANFSVVATGAAPLAFQWFLNGNQIPGATSATLTITNVQAANSGSYHVTVTNPGGTTTSVTVTLTLSTPPPSSGGGGGGGGGGGAPSLWFTSALLALVVARRIFGGSVSRRTAAQRSV